MMMFDDDDDVAATYFLTIHLRFREISGTLQENVILLVDEIYVAKEPEFSSASGRILGLTELDFLNWD